MFKKSITFAAIFIGIFAGLFVANSAIVNSTYAYELTVTTSGDTIIEPQNGQVITKTSEITVKTDCRAGYTLQIQGPTDANLYLDGDATKNEANKFIKPVNATSALNTQPNTYGYNLTSNQINQIFNPLAPTAETLKDLTETASPTQDINETTNIYWGAYASLTLAAGTYKLKDDGAVIYQVVTSPICSSYTVEFNANGGSGTMIPQQIVAGSPTPLSANAFTAENAKDGFLGWNTKADGTGIRYSNEQTVTDLAEEGETITLYAQWGCPPNTICYDDNGANSVTKMGNQATSSTTTILWATNFQRQEYGFLGWGKNSDGSGVMYGPNQTIDTSDLGYEGLKLYAIWKRSEGDLQNWQGCESLDIGGTTALTDTRDNQTYAIARLQDGNCWMIENMRLNDSATMTATDTDNPAISKLWSTSVSDSYGCWYESSAACVDRPLMSAVNTLNSVSEMKTANENIYGYGNYYNWNAATAGQGVYNTISTDVAGSICPIGWKLPLGNVDRGSGSYSYLDIRLGGIGVGSSDVAFNNKMKEIWRSYPNNFVMNGLRSRSSIGARGTKTMMITSAAFFNYINFYGFDIQGYSGGNYYPGNSTSSKSGGFAVRCVIKMDNLYFIDFNANGGSGEMADQFIKTGVSTNLSASQFTAPKSWQVFKGWNTEPDGTGTSYSDGQSVSNLVGTGQTLTLYAQWGCPANTICYDDNGAESPTKMGLQQDFTSASEIKLWPSNYQREGYGFAGWNTKPDGTGTMYGPVETISDSAKVSDIKTNGMALYATWVQSAGDLQGWNGCKTMSAGDVTALTDKRDNQTYAVAKLSDGKCWMIENLRLDNQYTVGEENKALSQGYAGNFIGLADPESRNFSSTSTANSLYSTDGSTAVTITNATSEVLFPRYNNQNTAKAIENLTSWTGAENVYSLGNYYTWAAAVASTTPHNNNNTVVPDTSICPASWRLPVGGNKKMEQQNEPWQLIVTHLNNGVLPNNYETAFGDRPTFLGDGEELQKVMATYPNNFIYAGTYQGNKLEYRNTASYSWTSTVSETAYAYSHGMVSFSKSVMPGTAIYNKYYGLSIRCIFNPVFTVDFDANGGSGDMADQSIQVGIATKLSANAFTNSPKSFVGWNTKPDGTGAAYTDEEEVTDLTTVGETITLYAQWTEPTPLEQISTMQEMTSGICSATPVGTEAVLEDARDGKTYSVAKLKDGNCWMTEDLDHDIDATKTYTPADTDISSNWTPDVSTINIQGLNVGENVSGWVGAFGDNGLASADPGEVYWDGSTNRHSRIGNYYNWTAALAANDSGAYSNGTETDPSQNPQTSICPKGWRLPIIANEITGHVDEFKELNRLYNNGVNSTDSGLIASPLYFTRGGAIDQSSELQGVGDAGSYWSSTAGGPMYVFNTAYYFNHDANYNDSYSSNIAYGYNIRCVARQSYTVSFDSNGGSGTMSEQTINANMPTKLITNSFTIPAGYFLGWNTKSNGSGASIADNELVTNLANANENITLYAQWYRYTLADISTMQEMNSDICANTSTPEVNATSVPEKQLRDTRDNKMYWVAKLADGKCWMTQNLDLDLDETKTYTPSDTDLIENWTPLRSTIDASNVTNRIVPGFEYISTSPYSVDPGDWYWKNDPFYASTNNLFLNNQAGDKFQKNTAFASNGAHGHVGNYYNWTAVIASNDSNEYSADATSDISKRPPNSICPKGWRLPMASNDSAASEGSTNEFGRLNYLYNNGATNTSQNLEAAPLYFVRAGYISNGGAQFSAGNSSIYNSSISRGDTNTFQGMTLRSTAINSNAPIARSGAGSVRCVAW